MTEKVAPVMERMRELAELTRNEALEGLAPGAREHLVDTLTHIRANLSERSLPREAKPEAKDSEAADYASG